MKTKSLLSLCLVMGIAITQLSAQSDKGLGNKTLIETVVWDYWQPVYCNGLEVDYLFGEVNARSISVFKNGILVKSMWHSYGNVTSDATGEVFTLLENSKTNIMTLISTWHFTLKGNEGTHYLGSMTWDQINDPNFLDITVNRASCPGNK